MCIYSIDSSALVDAWKYIYAPKNFPRVWERIEEIVSEGKLKCAEEVYDEIVLDEHADNLDDLAEWMLGHKEAIVYPTGLVQEEILRLQQIVQLAHPNGKSQGDPWVVALAMKFPNCSVVAHEKESDNAAKLYKKIPEACKLMNIKCIHIWQIIQEQDWHF